MKRLVPKRNDATTCTALLLFALTVAPLLSACATTPTPGAVILEQDESMAPPAQNFTRFGGAVAQFGTMLRAYPRALTDPVSIEVPPILNTSGVTDGLPTDLAPVLRTILAKIGRPIEVVDRTQVLTDLRLMEMGQLDHQTLMRRPLLSVRGSITEGETRLRKGWGVQMDALIPVKSGNETITNRPGGSVTAAQRDEELDLGFGTDRDIELTTLAIDLQIYDNYRMTAIDRLAESYRVNVARSDKSYAFGIFFEGSGLGFRSRVVGIQSKSRALRMASELAIIHLLGRYFRVPWWRIVTDVTTDEELVRWYRQELEVSDVADAAGRLKLLLYAHGYDADIGVEGLTQQEVDISLRIKQELGMDPYAQNDYKFMAQLWQTVPFESTEQRMESVRRKWQEHVLEARRTPPAAAPGTAPRTDGNQVVQAPSPLPPSYPTVAKCCPFRFEQAPQPYSPDEW